jgi:hypothetical protein
MKISMRNTFITLLVLVQFVTVNTVAAKNQSSVERDLSSLDGLMRLIPQLKNANGQFAIPNPKTDLQNFLLVHQSLTNIIEMALAQANAKKNPYSIAGGDPRSLTFPSSWRSAEVGVMTDGKTISFPDGGNFAGYGGESFLNGISVVPGTGGTFYQVAKPNGTVPALVYAQPTLIPCINRLVLAAADTAGTWMPPSYALGTKDGKAYLIVNKCIDLGLAVTQNGVQHLGPNAILFTAIQWADSPDLAGMRTNDKCHQH